MKKHLVQSDVWAEYQRMEGKKVFQMETENFSTCAWLNQTILGDYLFVGYGPHMEGKYIMRAALRSLVELARSEHLMFVRIEPTMPVTKKELEVAIHGTRSEQKRGKSKGFTRIQVKKVKEIEPEHTWVLDLKGVPEEEILRGMESNKVRSWRNMAKRGMSVRISEDPGEIGILMKLLDGVSARDHFTPQDEAHLRRQMEAGFAKLYIVELDGGVAKSSEKVVGGDEKTAKCGERRAGSDGKTAKCSKLMGDEKRASEGVCREGMKKIPIAASLIYDYNYTRYYAHSGTDDTYRKLRAGAVLLVQMILDASRAGMYEFDFWGITTSEDPTHPWYGFTQFKKAFGGRQVDYGGTWDIIVNPYKYKLYEAMRWGNLKVRKIRK